MADQSFNRQTASSEQLREYITQLLSEGNKLQKQVAKLEKEMEVLQVEYESERVNSLVKLGLANAAREERDQRDRRIEELISELATYRSNPPTTFHNSSPTSPKVKPNKPKPFDGTRANTDHFLNQLYLYFEALPSEFPTDRSKILFALTFMTSSRIGQSVRADTQRGYRTGLPIEWIS